MDSANTSIATVNQTDKVTAVSAGAATIIITTSDGALEARCKVWVKPVLVEEIALVPADYANAEQLKAASDMGFDFPDDSVPGFVEVGKSLKINANVYPANAADKTVTWASSNNAIASVDQNGIVTGVADGVATITATANDAGGVKETTVALALGMVEASSTTGTKKTYYHPLRSQSYLPWWSPLLLLGIPYFIQMGGGFGDPRGWGTRAHAGIDFIRTLHGDAEVYAVTAGKIVNYIPNFVQGTHAIDVKNDDGTWIRYGEIKATKTSGRVYAGEKIGTTKKWSSGNMLHLEYYSGYDQNGKKYSDTSALNHPGNRTYDDPNVPSKRFNRRRDLLNPSKEINFVSW